MFVCLLIAVLAAPPVPYATAYAVGSTGAPLLIVLSGPGCPACEALERNLQAADAKGYLAGITRTTVQAASPQGKALSRENVIPVAILTIRDGQRWRTWRHTGSMTPEQIAEFVGTEP